MNVPQIFVERVRRAPDAHVLYTPEDCDPLGGGRPWGEVPGWRVYTLREALEAISGLARRLVDLGVGEGVPVAILADTSHAWTAVDLAVLGLGGVVVGIYPSLTGEQVAWQLRHSRAQVLVLDRAEQADKMAPYLGELPDLRHVFSIFADSGHGIVPLRPAAPDVDWYVARADRVRLDQPATVVYTSGTTGLPKGAVLTHGNFDAIIRASAEVIPTRRGDRSVLFLPLAHSLQRFVLYRGMAEEARGWFARSLDALPEAMAAARPHVLATVPRMLEKIKATAEGKAAARGPRAAAIFAWAIRVGRARNHHLWRQERVPLRLRLQHALAERLVYRTVRQALGGCLRTFISGGAALSVEVAEWFEAVGIQVREGWGLTETCAPAAINSEREFRLGTVGRPLPGVLLRLDEDGEILVKGPGNFIGYLDDPEATAAAFTDDGFFRTGDVGSVDDDGFLRILDRKKEIIVTAGGKNIPPVNLEKRLQGGLVDQAVVLGDERPYLVALLSLDPGALAALASQGSWPGGPAQWSARPEVRALLAEQVERANEGLARFETIKRFDVLPEPLSIENGELTPTLKLKRRVIKERHAARIEALYA